MTPAALPPVAFAPRRLPVFRLTLAAALLAQAGIPALARAADEVPQLSPVRVTGAAEKLSDPGQTEGSQSYTANCRCRSTGACARSAPRCCNRPATTTRWRGA